MWKRVVPWLTLCSVVAVGILVARHLPANPPPQGKDAPANGVAAPPAAKGTPVAATPGVNTATSRVVAVTVYQNSALVAREVDVPAGPGMLELTVTPLPPTTINSSLYTEGTADIRVLTTRFRTRAILEDTRADVRKLQDELRQLQLQKEKLEADIKAVQANAKSLDRLDSFMEVTTIQSTEKGTLNSEAAITLNKHVREGRLAAAKELVALQQQVQDNRDKAEFASRQLKELAASPSRTERDAVIVVEKKNGTPGKVRLNYLVESASWRPQYKLHAGKTAKEPVQLEYLAAVAQHTGEDWGNVKLVLSTAQPTLNAAPPELQVLQVTVAPQAAPTVRQPDIMELEERVKELRGKGQQNLNAGKVSSGTGLVNTAAALDQSFELFNPEAAMKRGCSLAVREGPTVTYHLNTNLTVPSRSEDQILEVTRLDIPPDYYYKAVPILTSHVYRLADLTNRSNYVLLPGEATMYIGTDFVGQMNLPLVAIGETFTAGFGIDPQLQIQRQMTDRSRTTQGGNQVLKYEYRILVNSYKSEPVKLQVWERLPRAESETVGVNLLKAAPDISTDALYLREQRPNNLLRWDVRVEPHRSGEKALAINYEFKLELDRRMTISSFQSAGVFGAAPATPAPTPAAPVAALPPMSSSDQAKIKAAMAKLSAEDRRLAEAQVFCAIDQESPLGSTGPIFKEMIKGQPVFLCCRGCVAEARTHPDQTLTMLQKLKARMGRQK
ncbi:MAG TPA: mucoidy inhibitor MuiA family protein [Gemmataceae bacterium]|nr:mucoidy inhibitor MuiA family protein [Gemmataceae bacterium]